MSDSPAMAEMVGTVSAGNGSLSEVRSLSNISSSQICWLLPVQSRQLQPKKQQRRSFWRLQWSEVFWLWTSQLREIQQQWERGMHIVVVITCVQATWPRVGAQCRTTSTPLYTAIMTRTSPNLLPSLRSFLSAPPTTMPPLCSEKVGPLYSH